MKTIKIVTTLEDMKRWNSHEDNCCPIKWAIERATGISRRILCVGASGFLLPVKYDNKLYGGSWPIEVEKWINDLDNEKATFPITFEMEIP